MYYFLFFLDPLRQLRTFPNPLLHPFSSLSIVMPLLQPWPPAPCSLRHSPATCFPPPPHAVVQRVLTLLPFCSWRIFTSFLFGGFFRNGERGYDRPPPPTLRYKVQTFFFSLMHRFFQAFILGLDFCGETGVFQNFGWFWIRSGVPFFPFSIMEHPLFGRLPCVPPRRRHYKGGRLSFPSGVLVVGPFFLALEHRNPNNTPLRCDSASALAEIFLFLLLFCFFLPRCRIVRMGSFFPGFPPALRRFPSLLGPFFFPHSRATGNPPPLGMQRTPMIFLSSPGGEVACAFFGQGCFNFSFFPLPTSPIFFRTFFLGTAISGLLPFFFHLSFLETFLVAPPFHWDSAPFPLTL